MISKVQRAKVESKSQQRSNAGKRWAGWYQKYKELKLKANHNYMAPTAAFLKLISKVQRAKVESKSQPEGYGCGDWYVDIKSTKS